MKKTLFLFTILIFAALLLWCGFTASHSYYLHIPVEISKEFQLPITTIEIQGKQFPVEIDLGTNMPLSLQQDRLKKIKKNPFGMAKRMDFRGKKYESPLYLIPSARIGDLQVYDIKAKEESTEFSTQGSILYSSRKFTESDLVQYGRIGRSFFKGKNIFMDFQHSLMILCEDIQDLKKEKYRMDNFMNAPFDCTAEGIVIEVETDLGMKKFALDTGSTKTLLRKTNTIEKVQREQLIQSKKFMVNGADFGPSDIYLIEFSPEFTEIDGLLGMDFLQKHAVYLNFKNKKVFISQ